MDVWLTTPIEVPGARASFGQASPGRRGTGDPGARTRAREPGISAISARTPFTSAWSGSPITTTGRPRAAKSRAARWARATKGQVASRTASPFSAALRRSAGETPCAGKMTVPPSGTSSMESAKETPCAFSSSSTSSLCTSWWRQQAPGLRRARAVAALTPAHGPCGDRTSIFMRRL